VKDILKIILSNKKVRRDLLLFILCIVVVEGITKQIWPFFDREVLNFLERAKGEDLSDPSHLTQMFLFLALVNLFLYIFSRISYYLGSVLDFRTWKEVFAKGYEKLIFHDVEYINSESSGELLSKVNRAANRISESFTSAFSAFLRNFIKASVSLVILFSISWEIGVGVLVSAFFYSLIHLIRFRKTIPLNDAQDKIWDEEFSRVWETIPQIKLVKTFGKEEAEKGLIDKFYGKVFKINKKIEKYWNIAIFFEYFLVEIPTILTRFLAVYFTFQGRFGIPTLVLVQSMINNSQEPFWVVNWFMLETQMTVQRSKQYLKILRSEERVLDPKDPEILKNPKGDIEFKEVSFRYQDGKDNVLENLNIKFEGGKITALVGKSGSGKSTITGLICRFFDPTSGEITISGTPINKVLQKDLRSCIGLVMQDSYVFSGTIRENLLYAKEGATENEINDALKRANAWEFVEKFEKGLDTEIGERGVKLSGGQRQRISIARAILKDPPILILDEATNSLDSESEKLVQESLESFMKGRTVIIVAHRLSTIKMADKICVIENGKVIEEGNHNDLAKKDGVYKMLYDIQSTGFAEKKKVLSEYEIDY